MPGEQYPPAKRARQEPPPAANQQVALRLSEMEEGFLWYAPTDLQEKEALEAAEAYGSESTERARLTAERQQQGAGTAVQAAWAGSQEPEQPLVLPYWPVELDERQEQEERLLASGWRPAG